MMRRMVKVLLDKANGKPLFGDDGTFRIVAANIRTERAARFSRVQLRK